MLSVAEGAKLAARAQASYQRGEAGFYVANAWTKLPTRGPFADRIVAEAQCVLMEPPAMTVLTIEAQA